ncbi:MAG: hypothetical protein ACFB2W_03150 [Leptolyngbyaceae cyanobacterium]
MLNVKLYPLVIFSLLLAPVFQQPAQALGISFELAPAVISEQPAPAADRLPDPLSLQSSKPLPIPPEASQPPIRTSRSQRQLPDNVIASARILSPPPVEAIPTTRVLPPVQPPAEVAHQPVGLSFESVSSAPPAVIAKEKPTDIPDWIYEGGADSLVARVVGSAEGTRTASGRPTRAYYGHTDPGNGVWNMGTFSYQHGAPSPQAADKKQLLRLQKQGKTIAKQAHKADLSMTLGEVLNGLDLANQSPKAALERGGYIDRLAQAKEKGIPDSDAIVWARTYAYLDPDTQRWNAPGLGNTLPSIQRDQTRRHDAITRAFNTYHAQRYPDTNGDTNALMAPVAASATAHLEPAENSQLAQLPTLSEPFQSEALEFRVADNQPTQSNSSPPASLKPQTSPELSQTIPAIPESDENSQAAAVSKLEQLQLES